MTITLNSYPLLERTRWWILAIVLATIFARLFGWLAHTQYRNTVLIAGAVALIGWILVAGITKQCSLDSSSRSITSSTIFFGLLVGKKTVDISQAAWVRARLAGSQQTALVVEIGTNGYRTTQLLKMSSKSGKNIPQAEKLCSLVAFHLELYNKGYKGLA